MAYYNKVGLLILSEDKTKFLVCEKDSNNVTANYIMPGCQFQEKTVEECLKNEIKEELNCEVNLNTLDYIGEYIDIAAGHVDKNVSIKLYRAEIFGKPTPTTEIKKLHWISKKDKDNLKVSSIIRNKIIPDLIKRKILL